MTTAHRIDSPSRTHDWHGTHLLVVYRNGLPDLGVFAVLARGGGRGGAGVPRCESEARRDACSTPESLADTGHGPSSASKQRQQSKRHTRAKTFKRASHSTRVASRVSLSHHQLCPLGRTKAASDLCLVWTTPERIRGTRGGRGRKEEKSEDSKVCNKRITPRMRIHRLCSRRPGDDFSSPLPGSTLE